jgi:hypothetical protein
MLLLTGTLIDEIASGNDPTQCYDDIEPGTDFADGFGHGRRIARLSRERMARRVIEGTSSVPRSAL